jgi:L-threonylcarbamoyladenylate synthase
MGPGRVERMKTRILRIDPSGVAEGQIDEIAGVLLEGRIAAYPTETFYGLGAAAFSKKAVARIYALKKRNTGKPLPLIASDMEMVKELASSLPGAFWTLAGEFWPGPLTLVLKASAALPAFITGPGGSVAVRVPPLAWLRKLVGRLCQPLTATSANLSGQKELADPRDVAAAFEGRIALLIDGGSTPGGAPSTLVDLTTESPRVLREGVIPAARILALLGL